jgi:hypothetical protein
MRPEIYFQFFNHQIWLNHFWNDRHLSYMTKKFKILVGIAAWQNLLPISLFLTADSMQQIIGHTCAPSAKVVWQTQLM